MNKIIQFLKLIKETWITVLALFMTILLILISIYYGKWKLFYNYMYQRYSIPLNSSGITTNITGGM